ncbi:hypothetical protein OQA88_7850 [Cercophora sp. LCS_1]
MADKEDETSPLLGTPTPGFDTIPSAPAEAPKDTKDTPKDEPASPPAPTAPTPGPSTAPVKPPTPPPAHEAVVKADLEVAWSEPAGLRVRGQNDENLVIFRRAVGINSSLSGAMDSRSLEEGRKHATGMYAATLKEQREKKLAYNLIQFMVYASHFLQIIVGASLTALGPSAGDHTITITILGATNTVVAGVLALVKGQGLPERLRQDRAEFRKLQDWIEQTEALLAVGVIGKDRKEVGLLVQIAFVKYNAAKASEENNIPENYIRERGDDGAGALARSNGRNGN